ncbi:MAG: dimethyl sulfoxide reductase anchor subunit [Eggerthellaceae bacterium]|nr:dimethyl sulfoxide reductase anchor subunit [Eggerthellaceae bacterium]
MEAAFAEMPLALFTTLASIGAGAFITLACAFFTAKLTDEQLARVDKMAVIPAIVVIVGFIAAFFHLANAGAAFGVFAGIGRSPMSNEICAGVVFAVVMVVYVILGLAGKVGAGARKGFGVALAVLAVIFAITMGAAYGISTIPSWNTPWPVVQVLGYALLGGVALGLLALALAGALGDAAKTSFKTAAIAVAAVGCVLAVAGLGMMASGMGALSNALVTGAELLSGAMTCLVVAIVGLVLAFVAVFMSVRGEGVAWPAVAAIAACVGVLAGRLVFYALQISVGLFF